ncbi:hypothetical protein K474DRAFT_1678479 [Panus rudis PR-1116 ss-1]|nr:hypothetical protein K474DRAFT_1678479 [Panus rudis PR-1116 ss-1]
MPVIDAPRIPAEDRLRVLDIPSRVETDNGEGDLEDSNEGDPEGDPNDDDADNECDESREDEEDEIEGEDEDKRLMGDGDDDAADKEHNPEDGKDEYGDGEEDYEGFAPLFYAFETARNSPVRFYKVEEDAKRIVYNRDNKLSGKKGICNGQPGWVCLQSSMMCLYGTAVLDDHPEDFGGEETLVRPVD